jgi:hypothetical protein
VTLFHRGISSLHGGIGVVPGLMRVTTVFVLGAVPPFKAINLAVVNVPEFLFDEQADVSLL